MPRPKHPKALPRKNKLSRDAAIILALHKSQPLNLDELIREVAPRTHSKETPALRKYVHYDHLNYLIEHEIVRVINRDSESWYALADYGETAAEVKWFVEDFELLRCRWPTVEEISLHSGLVPDEAKKEVYKLAPATGWRPPTKKDLKNSSHKMLLRLELAAWMKLGCGESPYVKIKWRGKELEKAERILKHKKYQEYVPEIHASTKKDREIVHYECWFFDLGEVSGLPFAPQTMTTGSVRADELGECIRKLRT